MRERLELYRARKKTRDKTPLSPGTMWQVVVGLFLIFSVLAGVMWLLDADFDSEYRRTPMFSIPNGLETRGTRLSMCGVARTLLPESLGAGIPCVWWNLGALYIVPAIALGYAIKSSLSRG